MGVVRVLTFDCDGVLFDTEAANKAFYNQILAHLNRPPMTEAQFAHAQMHTADQALANLFPDAASYARAQAYRKETGYEPFIPYMEMAPDLIDVLEKYRSALSLAVATNRSDTMGRVLEIHDIAHYFDLVVTALDVDHPKPHPEPLLRVLAHFDAAPEEMIYVGDSLLDAQAAEAAGVPFVACGNQEIPGDYHISRLSELDTIIPLQANRVSLYDG
jgi:HAD superfamily hydrolase (TIGR01549 family)